MTSTRGRRERRHCGKKGGGAGIRGYARLARLLVRRNKKEGVSGRDAKREFLSLHTQRKRRKREERNTASPCFWRIIRRRELLPPGGGKKNLEKEKNHSQSLIDANAGRFGAI